jgi:hypothetical protein
MRDFIAHSVGKIAGTWVENASAPFLEAVPLMVGRLPQGYEGGEGTWPVAISPLAFIRRICRRGW